MIMILICLVVLHLGATKMHMIQTGWQKNLHTSFLTKHSLLNSRYRSSVKIISATLVVWWTIQWLILVHTWLYMSVSHLFNFSLWVIFLTRYMYTCLQRSELLPCVPLFCLVPHFDIVCELLLNWCTAPWNLLILLIIYMKNYLILIGWEQCSTSVTRQCKKCNSVQKV